MRREARVGSEGRGVADELDGDVPDGALVVVEREAVDALHLLLLLVGTGASQSQRCEGASPRGQGEGKKERAGRTLPAPVESACGPLAITAR